MEALPFLLFLQRDSMLSPFLLSNPYSMSVYPDIKFTFLRLESFSVKATVDLVYAEYSLQCVI